MIAFVLTLFLPFNKFFPFMATDIFLKKHSFDLSNNPPVAKVITNNNLKRKPYSSGDDLSKAVSNKSYPLIMNLNETSYESWWYNPWTWSIDKNEARWYKPWTWIMENRNEERWDNAWPWIINIGNVSLLRPILPMNQACSLLIYIKDNCDIDVDMDKIELIDDCISLAPTDALAKQCAQDTAEDAAKIAVLTMITFQIKGYFDDLSPGLSMMIDDDSIVSFTAYGLTKSTSLIGLGQNASYSGIAYLAKKLIEQSEDECLWISDMTEVLKEAFSLVQKPECNEKQYDSFKSIHESDTVSWSALLRYFEPDPTVMQILLCCIVIAAGLSCLCIIKLYDRYFPDRFIERMN